MKLKIALLALIFFFTALNASDCYVVKSSQNSVGKTVEKLEKFAKEIGFDFIKVIDHKSNTKEAGISILDMRVVLVSNAKIDARILRREPKAGIELPIRIYVYKDYDDRTKVEYVDMKEFEKRFNLIGCGVLPKLQKMLNSTIDRAIKK